MIEYQVDHTDYDALLASYEQDIAQGEELVAETRKTIAQLEQQPDSRQIELGQAERRLESTRANLEVARQQAFDFYGTEHESAALESQRRHETDIARFERELPALRAKYQRENAEEREAIDRLRIEESQFARQVQDNRMRLQEIRNAKQEAHDKEGEKHYKLVLRQYNEVAEDEKAKRQAAIDAKMALNSCISNACEKLADYPEYQQKLEQEHGIVQEDALSRIVRAGLSFIDAIILDGMALETQQYVPGGRDLLDTLTFTDMDLVAHTFDGGLSALRERRAILSKFLSSYKA